MRASGILMHISSLPSPWGIGTLGREAGKKAGSAFGTIGKKVGGNLGAAIGRGIVGARMGGEVP